MTLEGRPKCPGGFRDILPQSETSRLGTLPQNAHLAALISDLGQKVASESNCLRGFRPSSRQGASCIPEAPEPGYLIEPELKRHVEARIIPWRQRLHTRDVMDAIAAGADEIPDLLDPDPARVDFLRSKPWLETALKDHEDQGMKEGNVVTVERAVDEETAFKALRRSRHRLPGYRAELARALTASEKLSSLSTPASFVWITKRLRRRLAISLP